MSQEIEELEKQINDAYKTLNALKEKKAKLVDYPGAVALVGKCFKYKNCYSCPSKPSDYWWLYVRVTKADRGWVNVKEFQTDRDGKCEVCPSQINTASIFNRGYVEISKKEWNKARAKFLAAVKAIL